MEYKDILLVSDMDGTLLNPDHAIFEENIDAIRYFVNNGGCFTIATGREWHALAEYARQLPLSLPLILVNGAQIYDPVAKKVLLRNNMKNEGIETIMQLAEKFSHLGLIAVSDRGAAILRQPADRETMPFFYEPYPVSGMTDIPDNVYKFLFVGSASDLREPREIVAQKHGIHLSSTCSYPTLLDIMAAGVSKGSALNILTSLIDPECIKGRKIIAVGDQENDVEMFAAADYAFAMRQASDYVRKTADAVLTYSDEPFMPLLLEKIQKL